MKFTLFLIVILCSFTFVSCDTKPPLSAKQLRTGTFTSTLDNTDLSTTFIRNDSIQIDYFEEIIDTSYITWISDFEYVLKKKNPTKKDVQNDFYVRITGIHDNSYTFKGHFKGSNFKFKGKATLQEPNSINKKH